MQAVLPLSPLLRIAGGPGQPKARGLWPSGASFRSDRQATTVTSLRPYDTVVPTLLFTVEGEGTCRFARSFPFPFLSHLFLHTRREKRGPLFCLGWAGSKLHLLMLPEDRLHLSQVFPFPLPRFSIKGGHTVVSSDSLRGIYIGKRTSSRYYWVQARGAKQGREAPDR